MAYSTKYQVTVAEDSGWRWRVNIQPDGWGGGITDLTPDASFLRWTVRGSGTAGNEIFAPLRPGAIQFAIRDVTGDVLLELASGDRRDYRVVVERQRYIDGSNPGPWQNAWYGLIVQDFYQDRPYEAAPRVVVEATDGLEILKTRPYKGNPNLDASGNVVYQEDAHLVGEVREILMGSDATPNERPGLTPDLDFETLMEWYFYTTSSSPIGSDPIDELRARAEAFRDEERGDLPVYQSEWAFLNAAMRRFQMRLLQSPRPDDGAVSTGSHWRMQQRSNLVGPHAIRYRRNGATLGIDETGPPDERDVSDWTIIGSPNRRMVQPVQEAASTYEFKEVGQGDGILLNNSFEDNSGSFNEWTELTPSSGMSVAVEDYDTYSEIPAGRSGQQFVATLFNDGSADSSDAFDGAADQARTYEFDSLPRGSLRLSISIGLIPDADVGRFPNLRPHVDVEMGGYHMTSTSHEVLSEAEAGLQTLDIATVPGEDNRVIIPRGATLYYVVRPEEQGETNGLGTLTVEEPVFSGDTSITGTLSHPLREYAVLQADSSIEAQIPELRYFSFLSAQNEVDLTPMCQEYTHSGDTFQGVPVMDVSYVFGTVELQAPLIPPVGLPVEAETVGVTLGGVAIPDGTHTTRAVFDNVKLLHIAPDGDPVGQRSVIASQEEQDEPEVEVSHPVGDGPVRQSPGALPTNVLNTPIARDWHRGPYTSGDDPSGRTLDDLWSEWAVRQRKDATEVWDVQFRIPEPVDRAWTEPLGTTNDLPAPYGRSFQFVVRPSEGVVYIATPRDGDDTSGSYTVSVFLDDPTGNASFNQTDSDTDGSPVFPQCSGDTLNFASSTEVEYTGQFGAGQDGAQLHIDGFSSNVTVRFEITEWVPGANQWVLSAGATVLEDYQTFDEQDISASSPYTFQYPHDYQELLPHEVVRWRGEQWSIVDYERRVGRADYQGSTARVTLMRLTDGGASGITYSYNQASRTAPSAGGERTLVAAPRASDGGAASDWDDITDKPALLAPPGASDPTTVTLLGSHVETALGYTPADETFTVDVTGTPGEVQVFGGAQQLSENPSFQVGLPNDVEITNSIILGGGNITLQADGSGIFGVYDGGGSTLGELVAQDLTMHGTHLLLAAGQTGSPSLNAGLEVERGDLVNVLLEWDEGVDRWGSRLGSGAFGRFLQDGDDAVLAGVNFNNTERPADPVDSSGEDGHLRYDRNYSEKPGGGPAYYFWSDQAQEWGHLYNSLNDGPGSGLNADLWDDAQFGDYLDQPVRTSDDVVFQSVQADVGAPADLAAIGLTLGGPALVLTRDDGSGDVLRRWEVRNNDTLAVHDATAGNDYVRLGGDLVELLEDTYIDQSLVVDQALTVGDPTSLEDTLDVIGATTLQSTLGVTGATTLGDTLGVTGATTLSSTLDVSGRTHFLSEVETDHFSARQQGWQITYAGEMDMRSIFADEMRVKSFIAELYSARAGAQIITKSRGILALPVTVPPTGGTEEITFEDAQGQPGVPIFEVGDTVLLHVSDRSGGGFTYAEVWMEVISDLSGSGGIQAFIMQRLQDGGQGTGATIYAGDVALDYGTPGDAVIETTTLGANAPYDRLSRWYDDDGDGIPDRYEIVSYMGELSGVAAAESSGEGFYADVFRGDKDILIGSLDETGSYLKYTESGGLEVRFEKTSGGFDTLAGVESAFSTFQQTIQTDLENAAYQYNQDEYDATDPPSSYNPKPVSASMRITGTSWPGGFNGTLVVEWADSNNATQRFYSGNGRTWQRRTTNALGDAWSSFVEQPDIPYVTNVENQLRAEIIGSEYSSVADFRQTVTSHGASITNSVQYDDSGAYTKLIAGPGGSEFEVVADNINIEADYFTANSIITHLNASGSIRLDAPLINLSNVLSIDGTGNSTQLDDGTELSSWIFTGDRLSRTESGTSLELGALSTAGTGFQANDGTVMAFVRENGGAQIGAVEDGQNRFHAGSDIAGLNGFGTLLRNGGTDILRVDDDGAFIDSLTVGGNAVFENPGRLAWSEPWGTQNNLPVAGATRSFQFVVRQDEEIVYIGTPYDNGGTETFNYTVVVSIIKGQATWDQTNSATNGGSVFPNGSGDTLTFNSSTEVEYTGSGASGTDAAQLHIDGGFGNRVELRFEITEWSTGSARWFITAGQTVLQDNQSWDGSFSASNPFVFHYRSSSTLISGGMIDTRELFAREINIVDGGSLSAGQTFLSEEGMNLEAGGIDDLTNPEFGYEFVSEPSSSIIWREFTGPDTFRQELFAGFYQPFRTDSPPYPLDQWALLQARGTLKLNAQGLAGLDGAGWTDGSPSDPAGAIAMEAWGPETESDPPPSGGPYPRFVLVGEHLETEPQAPTKFTNEEKGLPAYAIWMGSDGNLKWKKQAPS